MFRRGIELIIGASLAFIQLAWWAMTRPADDPHQVQWDYPPYNDPNWQRPCTPTRPADDRDGDEIRY